MIHYTCDLCGCPISSERYEAKIEVAPVHDPDDISSDDLTADHLQLIADEIDAMESTGEFELEETGTKKLNLDFCESCAQRFLRSPLNLSPGPRVKFSNN
ncbi:hypothetical protein Mal48_25920 [Thalassoglobus polymorphus]|uniref:Uncharacterized protein n=1 Tax=Thalassoglobus polymorphus TaxID=2527994 RepID=A0A517QNY4_9PLAN|nr:hypothetical protein Mal48_25920 [Thalassoglobus polymorphus]